MKIYTRRGDDGETGLFDGTRVPKDHERVAAYGDVDELNAALGLARGALDDAGGDLGAVLRELQRDLFAVGALLADPRRDGEDPGADERLGLPEARIDELERVIDAWEQELEPLKNFIHPSGTLAAGALHLCRAVARRAERSVVALVAAGAGHVRVVRYLNRVSDLLFVASRIANHRSGTPDEVWE